MNQYVKKVNEAAEFLRDRIDPWPDVAVILGTGLGGFADRIEDQTVIGYDDIPAFPGSTVSSHTGQLTAGTIGDRRIVALRGRSHLYEGYTAKEVTLATRVLGVCGTRTLIISNAAGGMASDLKRADLMLITDHINMMGQNPLEGANHDEWGPRFPDMSEPYSRRLLDVARATAGEYELTLKEGIYAGVVGPNLETEAEYRMLLTIGADAVGMSTVPEVIVAGHMGMEVLGISVITDECHPDTLEEVTIEDVLAAAEDARPRLTQLINGVISRLSHQRR